MYPKRIFLKLFFVLAIFSISYTLTGLYVLYASHNTALPDLFHSAIDVFAPDYTSCYYTEKEDSVLNLIDDAPKGNRSIFFHETTCQWRLRVEQACSVESAARAHPDREVYVIFTRGLTETDCHTGTLVELSKLRNIRIYRVDLNSYAVGTPLENVFMARITRLGKWHYRVIGEFLKFLTLYKFGGMVVDLDMMVVGSVDKLGYNWVSTSGGNLESGIVSVSNDQFGKYISKQFIRALKLQAAERGATHGGPALKDAVQILCNTTDISKTKANNCKGFHIYSEEFFNPGDNSWQEYSKASGIDPHVLGYHLWTNKTPEDQMPNNSLYASLARQYCPYVFSKFMSDENGKFLKL